MIAALPGTWSRTVGAAKWPGPVRDLCLGDDNGTTSHGVLGEVADLVHRPVVGQRAESGVLTVRWPTRVAAIRSPIAAANVSAIAS
ncbi:hypothetical protein PV420_33405 [Streptomyces europaeiscabiei]|nr:hypothetical protein [Streptomyces europaeiscabiei]MDX2528997.1 hypothetical protein [Streptomyces europaeiscabiei]